MTEWWTYRPSDFLMFSPRIYARLFGSINEAWWPLPLVIAAAVLAWVALGRGRWPRASGLALGAMVAFVGWAFLHQRLAPIFWVADAYACAFALQAAMLLALAAAPAASTSAVNQAADTQRARRRRLTAAGLATWAAIGHPLLAPVAARPWMQAEWPGFVPDPTMILTLAWLLTLRPTPGGWRRGLRRALWLVPLAWCAVSAATLATMGERLPAAVMIAAAGLAVRAWVVARARDERVGA